MSKLLREFHKLDYDVKAINEAREKRQPIILKGILQCAEEPNQNNRIYSREILERELENYQKAIKERRAIGELDHPDKSIVELKNASHLVIEAHWDQNKIIGEIEILDTPSGETLKSLLRSGVMLGISSRGIGNTTKNEAGLDRVDEFTLLCWDVVSEPSTRNAYMFIKEGKEVQKEEVKNLFSKNDRINRIVNDILKLSK